MLHHLILNNRIFDVLNDTAGRLSPALAMGGQEGQESALHCFGVGMGGKAVVGMLHQLRQPAPLCWTYYMLLQIGVSFWWNCTKAVPKPYSSKQEAQLCEDAEAAAE